MQDNLCQEPLKSNQFGLKEDEKVNTIYTRETVSMSEDKDGDCVSMYGRSSLRRKNRVVLKEDEDPHVLELEELIKEYERELTKRNGSIFSIQRNFESVSQLSRTLKEENAQLRQTMGMYEERSERYTDQESSYARTIGDQKELMNEMKESLNDMMQEDKINKKQVMDFNKMKGKCCDLEKDVAHLIVKNIDLSQQITDLSGLLKASEKHKIELKNKKAILHETQLKLKEKEESENEQNIYITKLKEQLTQTTSVNNELRVIITDLGEQKNYLCHLEATNTHILTQERKKIEELERDLTKLTHSFNSQSTLLYMKSSQNDDHQLTIKQLQLSTLSQKVSHQPYPPPSLFHIRQSQIEQIGQLKRDNIAMKKTCLCKKFKYIFQACEELQLSQSDTKSEINKEYTVVEKSAYDKLLNLLKVVTKNQNHYKKIFQKMSECTQFNNDKVNKIETITSVREQLSLQYQHNSNSVVDRLTQEIVQLNSHIGQLQNTTQKDEISLKNLQNQVEELECAFDLKNNELNHLIEFKNVHETVQSINNHSTTLLSLLNHTQILAVEIQHILSFIK